MSPCVISLWLCFGTVIAIDQLLIYCWQTGVKKAKRHLYLSIIKAEINKKMVSNNRIYGCATIQFRQNSTNDIYYSWAYNV